ncbi:MurR/RpiR family transcriptional regulator [uncultured Ruminococcus sp.]|uniref:MurR/RpiR family transcriptional regulator n=1 Tax=uncultured Ruminococcus sp. TaxID=165186 RepID=UPI00292EE6DB|nr:MurR/RpiR family transcriptional regulator [uncultured Ruminococcus sp.]
MVSNLLVRIDLSRKTFSKGQRRIASYIEEHYDEAAFMTAAKLGEVVGVSESTVVRFATQIGYEGYPYLQKAMQEMIRDKLNSMQRIEVTTGRIGNDDVVESVLNQDIDKIKRTIDEISREDFKKTVDAIINAENIYVFGVKSASHIAGFLAYYLDLIFGNVHVLDSTSKTTTFEKLFRISDKDVIIGISFPRYSTMAVEAMSFAHDRGAQVVAITDSMISPLVANADEVLLARSDIASVVDTLVAPLSLINALLVAIVIERKDEIIQTFAALEEVWKEQNVYALGNTEKAAEDNNEN